MFARAARFPATKDDGLPGPGAFDPRSPESKKKGAFLEKEERFKTGKHDGIGADWFPLPYALSCSDHTPPASSKRDLQTAINNHRNTPKTDNFGAYTHVEVDVNPLRKSRGRAVSLSQRNDEQKLDALRSQMTAQHTKEIKLLEQQLAKQAKDLEKLRLVETELKKEARVNATLEAATKVELKHAKEQLSLLPSLKKKFLDLVDEHATSKTRYTTSMDSLRSELAESEKRLKRSQAEEARLSAENLAKTREVGRLGDELGSVRAEKSKVEEDLKSKQREYEAEKSAREEAETLIEVERDHFAEQQAWLRKQAKALSANASAALAVQKQHHEVRCEKLQDRALAAEHRALRAERKALEKQDQITRLVDLVVVLEEEKAFLSEQLEDLQEEIEERELQRLQDANLWKKHAAEAVERLAEAMEDLEDVWNNATEEAELAEQEIRWLSDSLRCEEEQVGHLKGVEEEVVALSMQKTEQAQEIATLQSDVDSAYTSISEKDDKLHELETAFAKSHEDCTTTQEELASARAEIADVERRLSSTEHHLDQALHTLQTSEGRNEALLAEVAGLHEDLMDYIALQETHGELCKTIDRLTRTSSLAQEDADELARINADLVGHSNPSQKIRHLDRLRTDLAEIKKKHVSTLAELTAAQNQIKNLQSEIAAYKSVDGPSAAKHLQTSRLGPSRSILGLAGSNHVGMRAGNTEGGAIPALHVAKGALRVSRQRSMQNLR